MTSSIWLTVAYKHKGARPGRSCLVIVSGRQRVDTQGAVSNELGADNLLLVLINGAESWSIFKVASGQLEGDDCCGQTLPHVSSLWTWPVNLFCLFSPLSQGCPSFKHVLQWEKLRPVLRERDKNSELTCSLAAMWCVMSHDSHMSSHDSHMTAAWLVILHDMQLYNAATMSTVQTVWCLHFWRILLSREEDEQLFHSNIS